MYVNKTKLKIGIIGFGRMGQKYGKEILSNPLWELAYICDTGLESQKIAKELAPDAVVVDDEDVIFHDCGMHYVDVARWYAASEYKTYHAQGIRMWSHNDPWWIQVHGTFENGVVYDITQGFVCGHLSEQQIHNCYVDVIGTKGIARMTHNFKSATIELRGVSKTIERVDEFNDKKIDVQCDIFARSIIEGRNLGFQQVRDSVIASDMACRVGKFTTTLIRV